MEDSGQPLTSARPPFPEVFDSSIIAAVRSCGQKGNLEHVEHWKMQDQSVHLHAGAAYAHGLEKARTAFYVEGQSPENSVAIGVQNLLEFYRDFICPDDSPKSASRTAGALEFYFERYPLETDDAIPITLPGGKRGIEFGFAEPLDLKHPETGNPLIYCGRMDMIVDKRGMVLGEDDKTTSQLGSSWSRQWDLRSQFTGYTWGARRSGIDMRGFLIRGVSILKTKYDTAEAITYRPQWQIDRWEKQLYKDILDFMKQWETGEYNFNLDHACAEYGGCPFRTPCLSPDPTPILEQLYQRRKWNPITRQETIL